MCLILSLGRHGGVLFTSVTALLGVLGALGGEGARIALPLIMFGIIVFNILLQVCVAFIAALKARRLQLVHGLGEGSITGTIATIFTLALLWLLGMLTPPTALLIATIIFNGGMCQAL